MIECEIGVVGDVADPPRVGLTRYLANGAVDPAFNVTLNSGAVINALLVLPDLRNTNGDIEVLAASGGLEAVAEMGEVTAGFPKDFSGDAKITTGYGNITVKIDPAADCVVTASSFWGHVQTTLPLKLESGGDGEKKLSGRLNNGGPRITLSANGGHVKIMPGETLFN